MGIHNIKKILYYYTNTKCYPNYYDDNSATFSIDLKEIFKGKQNPLKLDNLLGIDEKLPNHFFLELVLKDRDRFLITYSGFIKLEELENEKYGLKNNM